MFGYDEDFDLGDLPEVSLESLTTFTDDNHVKVDDLETSFHQLKSGGVALEEYEEYLEQRGTVSKEDAIALEGICPGILEKVGSVNSYTETPSTTNYEATMEAINWKKVAAVAGATVVVAGTAYLLYQNFVKSKETSEKLAKSQKALEKQKKRIKKEKEVLLDKVYEIAAEQIELPVDPATLEKPMYPETRQALEDILANMIVIDEAMVFPKILNNQMFYQFLTEPKGLMARAIVSFFNGPFQSAIDKLPETTRFYEAMGKDVIRIMNEMSEWNKQAPGHWDIAETNSDYIFKQMDFKKEISEAVRTKAYASMKNTGKIKAWMHKYRALFGGQSPSTFWTTAMIDIGHRFSQDWHDPITDEQWKTLYQQYGVDNRLEVIIKAYDMDYLDVDVLIDATNSLNEALKQTHADQSRVTRMIGDGIAKAEHEGWIKEKSSRDALSETFSWGNLTYIGYIAAAEDRVTMTPEREADEEERAKMRKILQIGAETRHRQPVRVKWLFDKLNEALKNNEAFQNRNMSLSDNMRKLIQMHVMVNVKGPEHAISEYKALLEYLNKLPGQDHKNVKEVRKELQSKIKGLEKYIAALKIKLGG